VVVTNDTFKSEVLDSPIPVMIDFWAPWCMPCKMMDPILEQVADDYAGKLKVGRINVDEENELASQFDIVSIPTLLIFSNGKVADKKVGAVPRQIIEEFIKGHL
jgi:thioredoxin 1